MEGVKRRAEGEGLFNGRGGRRVGFGANGGGGRSGDGGRSGEAGAAVLCPPAAATIAAATITAPSFTSPSFTSPSLTAPSFTAPPRGNSRPPLSLKAQLLSICRSLKSTKFAWPYLHPVPPSLAPTYAALVPHPRDIETIEREVKAGTIASKGHLRRDLYLMASNCKAFNGEGNVYYTTAEEVEAWIAGGTFW